MQKTYDLKSIIVTISGVPITGFADGDAISIAWNSDTFTTQVGADGEVVRSKTNDPTAVITLNLLYSSMANNHLANLAQIDEISGAGSFSMMINDTKSGTTYAIPSAWISRPPDETLGQEAGSRAWQISAATIKRNVSGIVGFGGRVI